jgi:hypothetical protein
MARPLGEVSRGLFLRHRSRSAPGRSRKVLDAIDDKDFGKPVGNDGEQRSSSPTQGSDDHSVNGSPFY